MVRGSRITLVAGIVRDLLGGPSLLEAGLLSAAFRERLVNDLRSEPAIDWAVRMASRNRLMARENRGSCSNEAATPIRSRNDLLGDCF